MNRAGAIACHGSNGYIRNNEIIENIYADLDSAGSNYGGGITCSGGVYGLLHIMNNRIEKNRAAEGSAIYGGDKVVIRNNLILDNRNGLGAGIYVDGDAQIINNSFYGNDGYSIIYCKSGSPQILNNIIWGNSLRNEWKTIHIIPSPGTPVISYCDIQDGFEGSGNISSDPLFRNTAENDFHLKSSACGNDADSPCIDTGSPVYTDSILGCQAGLGTTLSDMGAYGGGKKVLTALETKVSSPNIPHLIRIFPNPFNSLTKIVFHIPSPQFISVIIYNLQGAQVCHLHDGFSAAGEKTLQWNGQNDQGHSVSSGIYLVRLSIDDRADFKKVLLMK